MRGLPHPDLIACISISIWLVWHGHRYSVDTCFCASAHYAFGDGRYSATAEAVGHVIYVIGGRENSLESSILSSVERLDLGAASPEWQLVSPLPVPRFGACSCTIDGVIYVIGGFSNDDIGLEGCSTTLAYDTKRDSWRLLPARQLVRAAAGVCAHQGLVWVVGGNTDVYEELSTVETYNPITETWTTMPSLCCPRSGPAVCVLDHQMYAIGGMM